MVIFIIYITYTINRLFILSIKYYLPREELVKFLNDQLQYVIEKDDLQFQKKYDKQKLNRLRKNKFKHMNTLFREFTDLIYFFEFIEKHYDELSKVFEDNIKDLMGYNKYYASEFFKDQPPDKLFNAIRVGPLARFVRSILLLNNSRSRKLDYRASVISSVLIAPSIKALRHEFVNRDELFMVTEDTKRTEFWARYLANQVNKDQDDKDQDDNRPKLPYRQIGY